jgi:hypothetical protein
LPPFQRSENPTNSLFPTKIHNEKRHTTSFGFIVEENTKHFVHNLSESFPPQKNYLTALGKTNAYARSTYYHVYKLKVM